MPVDIFDAYAFNPDPRKARYRHYSDWAEEDLYNSEQELVYAAEKVSAYLDRVGWADVEADSISPTALGIAVLQALNAPTVDVSSEAPLTVVIDPADPLAYAKVFGLIVSRDAGLLIDPYLQMPEFYELLEIPAITRILMSNKSIATKRPVVAKALAATDGRVEVRYVEEKLLHDRFFIPDAGDVLVFGSSLNSLTRRPGVVTPLADAAASGAIRDAYKKLWVAGTPIEPSVAKKGPAE